ISVLLGNGDGTLQAPTDYAVGMIPLGIAVGDFDGNGYPDLAVANNMSGPFPGKLSVLLNDPGQPAFSAKPHATAAVPMNENLECLFQDGDWLADGWGTHPFATGHHRRNSSN